MTPIYYERNLPHWHPPGHTFFLTYRLAGSIPMSVIRSMREKNDLEMSQAKKSLKGLALTEKIYDIQRSAFRTYDRLLDKRLNQPYWLKQPEIAGLVMNSLHFCAEKDVQLWAYCIMSNHVHVLLKHRETAPTLLKTLQHHKGFTGKEANRLLGLQGQFWQRETYDHVVRNQKSFYRIARYILNNPVKAKFARRWEDWPYTYVHPKLLTNLPSPPTF